MEQFKNTADKFFNDNNLEEAIENYTLALDFDSEDKYKVYLNRCLSFYKLKKYNEALSDAIKATRLKPDNAKAWGRLGSCLCALGKKSQAVCAFKKAYELEPTNENYKKESEKEYDSNDSDTEDEESTVQNLPNQEIFSLTKKLESMNFNTIPNFRPGNTLPNVVDTMLNNKMVDNMLNNMLSNEELIKKMSEQSFQNKILSYQNNPFEALKDKEMMSLMGTILKDITENKDVENKD
jgi:tetratricopeptide (TPR) repeat protein